MGRSSAFARSSASGPQGYQSTGLSLCCSRYGLVSFARRLGMMECGSARVRECVHGMAVVAAGCGAAKGVPRGGYIDSASAAAASVHFGLVERPRVNVKVDRGVQQLRTEFRVATFDENLVALAHGGTYAGPEAAPEVRRALAGGARARSTWLHREAAGERP